MSENTRVTAYPSRFLCEHTPSKSRIYAIVEQATGTNVLSAVLTCTDRAVAERAATVLNAAVIEGLSDAVQVVAAQVESALPAAPASSFRAALDGASKAVWLIPGAVGAVENREATESPYTSSATRSPHDARLRDLQGTVVRLMTLKEYHVYDQKRLLETARARGFEPMPADQVGDDDPHDLVGAVSFLADSRDLIPGADVVTEQEIMELLGPGTAEVADWSATPITADFGAGWRLRAREPKGPHKDTIWGRVPDFAVSFALSNCEACRDDEEDHWHLTPRTADLLHTALEVMSDDAYDDADSYGDATVDPEDHGWMVFDRLPKITWRQSASWRREFARAANDLADDLADGKWPTPTNSMEEMALHLAIEDAPSRLEMAQDSEDDDHASLPEHPDDYDWGICSEVLFQDHDILMLFAEDMNVIADPQSPANVAGGLGGLRLADWTEPFNNVKPRDPRRGFRR